MPTPRHGLCATEVDGIIYALGGHDGSSIVSTNEAYDPATDTWTTKASAPGAKNTAGAAAVNGLIYFVGDSTATYEYDPALDTWTSKASAPTARGGVSVAAVNNKVYMLGGNTVDATGLIYDPASNSWTYTSAAPVARRYLSPRAPVFGGLIYAIGGFDGSYNKLTLNEAYDPVTDTWSTKAPMPTARAYLAAFELGDRIYAVGGLDASNNRLNITESYDPNSDSWRSEAPASIARNWMCSAVVGDTAFVIGGYDAVTSGQTGAVESLQLLRSIFFRDPTDGSYFTDDKGNVLKLLDFGNLRAGETSEVKAIILENALDFAVTGVQVSKLEDLPAPDRLEISKTNNPFIAEDVLSFGGPYEPGDIATFYVRVVSDEDSSGLKPFKLKVRADIA